MKRLQTAAAAFLMARAVAFAAWPTTSSGLPPKENEAPAPTIAVTPTAAPSPITATPDALMAYRAETPSPTPTATPEPPYSEQDIDMLAKMVWGEARGCAPEEQALCVWTVINRLEDGRFGDTLQEVLTAPHQFAGYKAKYPITDEIRAVVEDALAAWESGETAPTLPPYAKTSGYLYFTGARGDDGQLHNFFEEEYR